VRVGTNLSPSVPTVEVMEGVGMSESLADLGLALVCETCECEIDFPDGLASEVGICRQCGMAFLVDEAAADSASRSA
jgi:hypothetical protein